MPLEGVSQGFKEMVSVLLLEQLLIQMVKTQVELQELKLLTEVLDMFKELQ